MSGDKIAKNLNFLIPLCSICVCVWRTHRNFSSFLHWWLLLAGLFSHPMDPLKLLIYISLYSAFGDVQCSSEERKEFEIFSNIRQKNIHEENVKSFPSMLGGENVWLKVVVTPPLFFHPVCRQFPTDFLCIRSSRHNTHLAMSSSLVETVVLSEKQKNNGNFYGATHFTFALSSSLSHVEHFCRHSFCVSCLCNCLTCMFT